MRNCIAILLAICMISVCASSLAEEIDLTAMTREQLQDLNKRINEELNTNHKLSSSEEAALQKAAKRFVEQVFAQNNMSVSWAWFDYDYVRDWGYATMSSHFDAEGEDKKSTRYDVVVGAYLTDGVWNVIYMALNGEDVYDLRDQIPDPRLNSKASELPEATPTPEPTPTPTPIPVELPAEIPTSEPTEEPTPEPTSVPTIEPTAVPVEETTPMPAEASLQESVSGEAEKETVEDLMMYYDFPESVAYRPFEEMNLGSKGNAVAALQNDLIFLRLLEGKADGDYGKKTKLAVEEFQREHADSYDADATGVADYDTQISICFEVNQLGGYEAMANDSTALRPMPEEMEDSAVIEITEYDDNSVYIEVKVEPRNSRTGITSLNEIIIQELVETYGFARYDEVKYNAVSNMSDGTVKPVYTVTLPKKALLLLSIGEISTYELQDYTGDLWINPTFN